MPEAASSELERGLLGMRVGLIMAVAIAALAIGGGVILALAQEGMASFAFGFGGLLLLLVGMVYFSAQRALRAVGVHR